MPIRWAILVTKRLRLLLLATAMLAISLVFLGGCQGDDDHSDKAAAPGASQGKTSLALVDATAAVKKNPRTVNGSGDPSDPVNIAIAGSKAQLLKAFSKAGWVVPDKRGLGANTRMATSVIFKKSYPAAPISDLYLYGRHQDIAFEQEVDTGDGLSPAVRHHVRFWQSDEVASDGTPIWLGAATFDSGVGVSFKGKPHTTHWIAPNIDEERQAVVDALQGAGAVEESGLQSGGLTSLTGLANADGNPMYTDGKIVAIDLSSK
ncbi:MAG: hypothetical protein FJ146_17775 [Deltaproteobacteria bacterium]|nr:hypothetical protein [Deltaproteobacteria bacterium]